MFNLESSITTWRAEMLATGIQSPIPLEELESHLRDDIAARIAAGAEPETAFNDAMEKLGHPAALKNEFDAARRPAEASARKTLFALVLFSLISLFIFLIPLSNTNKFGALGSNNQMSAIVACVVMFFVGWSGWFGHRFIPAIPKKRTRSIILGTAVVALAAWWMTFFYAIIPLHGYMPADFIVAFLWGFTVPVAFLMAVYSGLERAALRRTAGGPGFSPDSPPDAYLRSAFILLPAFALWFLSAVFVIPQLRHLWKESGVQADHAERSFQWFGNLTYANFAFTNFFKDHFFYLAFFAVLIFTLLEWRFRAWPRYRRSVLGFGVFTLNAVIIFSFFILFLAATLVATHLQTHIK